MTSAEHGGRLTHVDERGKARMVDVSGKDPTRRIAEARCTVRSFAPIGALLGGPDGVDQLTVTARLAGIQAAKQTSTLVPLCHPIRLEGVDVVIDTGADGFAVAAVAWITERTGVEMEALTACTAAALVLVQPLLAVDPRSSIEDLTLWHKSGGRSGTWERGPGGAPPGDPAG
jgi:cyclic pyranopterin phosphate synthase